MNDLATPSSIFKALGDEQRLKILEFLTDGNPDCCATGEGICGCDILGFTGLAQATVSHHMKILTQAGLVRGEKRGRWVYYSLNAEGFAVALETAGKYFDLAPKLIPLEVSA